MQKIKTLKKQKTKGMGCQSKTRKSAGKLSNNTLLKLAIWGCAATVVVLISVVSLVQASHNGDASRKTNFDTAVVQTKASILELLQRHAANAELLAILTENFDSEYVSSDALAVALDEQGTYLKQQLGGVDAYGVVTEVMHDEREAFENVTSGIYRNRYSGSELMDENTMFPILQVVVVDGVATAPRASDSPRYIVVVQRAPMAPDASHKSINLQHGNLALAEFDTAISTSEPVFTGRLPTLLPNNVFAILCYAPVKRLSARRKTVTFSLFGINTLVTSAISEQFGINDGVGLTFAMYDLNATTPAQQLLHVGRIMDDTMIDRFQRLDFDEWSDMEAVRTENYARDDLLVKEVIVQSGNRFYNLMAIADTNFEPVNLTSQIILSCALLVIALALSVFLVALEWQERKYQRKLRRSLAVEHKKLMSYMCHELRNPIHALNQLSGPCSSISITENVQHIHALSCHMYDLVNNFLDASKIEATGENLKLNTKVCCLAEVLHDVHRQFQTLSKAEKNLELKLSIESKLQHAEFNIDPVRLRQVISNGMSNASKYTESGTITLRLVEDTENQFVKVEVEDTGVGLGGIDPESLFEDYSQGDKKSHKAVADSGLGLGICRRIMEAHDGQLILANRSDGTGTLFVAQFPSHLQQAPAPWTACHSMLVQNNSDRIHLAASLSPLTIPTQQVACAELSVVVNYNPAKGETDSISFFNDLCDALRECGCSLQEETPEKTTSMFVEILLIDLDKPTNSNKRDSTPQEESIVVTIGYTKHEESFSRIGKDAYQRKLVDIVVMLPITKPHIQEMLKSLQSTGLPWRKFVQNRGAMLKRCSVLACDDDDVMQMILREQLRKRYDEKNSRVLADGLEVIDYFRNATKENMPVPDVILMDIVMTHTNGDKVCETLREMGINIPIVAVTGNSATEDIEALLECGFDAVISKPFTNDILDEVLHTVTRPIQIRQ